MGHKISFVRQGIWNISWCLLDYETILKTYIFCVILWGHCWRMDITKHFRLMIADESASTKCYAIFWLTLHIYCSTYTQISFVFNQEHAVETHHHPRKLNLAFWLWWKWGYTQIAISYKRIVEKKFWPIMCVNGFLFVVFIVFCFVDLIRKIVVQEMSSRLHTNRNKILIL